MEITAKVKCNSKVVQGEGDNRYAQLSFGPDYANDRNKEWALATPTLSLSMNVRGEVADRFESSKAYTLTFTETDEESGEGA